jgi:hypothetical protein
MAVREYVSTIVGWHGRHDSFPTVRAGVVVWKMRGVGVLIAAVTSAAAATTASGRGVIRAVCIWRTIDDRQVINAIARAAAKARRGTRVG